MQIFSFLFSTYNLPFVVAIRLTFIIDQIFSMQQQEFYFTKINFHTHFHILFNSIYIRYLIHEIKYIIYNLFNTQN